MKNWQRYWLYFLLVYSGLHLLRDIFQDLGVENWLSMVLVKPLPSKIPVSWTRIYWLSFNTYIAAVLEIVLSIICLRRNKFSQLGRLTLVIAAISLILWLFYWFFL